MNGDGPSTRAILRVVGVLLAVTLALWLIWVSRGVLTWVAIAAFLAVAINPLVNLLQDRLRLRRAPSILIVYILVAGLLTGAALLFVPPLIEAAQELTDEVPRYAERLEESDLVQRLDEEYDLLNRLEEETTSALEGVAGPDTAFDLARRVASGLVALISIGVICFLLSLYGRRVRSWVMDTADEPPPPAPRARRRPHLPGDLGLRRGDIPRRPDRRRGRLDIPHDRRRAVRAAAGLLGGAVLADPPRRAPRSAGSRTSSSPSSRGGPSGSRRSCS